MSDAWLDVRHPPAFEAGHRAGAINIPLEELPLRMHELPPPHEPLVIYDAVARRAADAAARLHTGVRRRLDVRFGAPPWPAEANETGPSRARLWRPHPLLDVAIEAARAAWGDVAGRRAIDVACGSGRDAVYLALSGFAVTALDLLPDAISRARDLAARCGVKIDARVTDVTAPAALPAGSADIVCVFRFLDRELLPRLRDAVRPGGFIVCETFSTLHRERHGKPRRDAFLLRPGELERLFADWSVAALHEGEREEGSLTAGIVARKPG